jgi:3-oxoacyl-[acyl-carrier protein] reductase
LDPRVAALTRRLAFTGPPASHEVGFTFSLTQELGPYGITANVVAPARILTDLLIKRMAGREQEWMSQTPMRRFGRPEEVAATIVFLASEDASYITGAVINVNGGLVMG